MTLPDHINLIQLFTDRAGWLVYAMENPDGIVLGEIRINPMDGQVKCELAEGLTDEEYMETGP